MFCPEVEHKIKVLKQQYNFIRDAAKDMNCGKAFNIPLRNAILLLRRHFRTTYFNDYRLQLKILNNVLGNIRSKTLLKTYLVLFIRL